MSLRAIGSLLARRFSSPVNLRTAHARSFHSTRDLPMGDGLCGAAGVVAAAFAAGAGGTVAVQYFRNDESAARKKPPKPLKVSEEEMKPRFEDWMKRNKKTYRDEKEKAMRFEVFKATVRWIELLPPSSQENVLPENCFADLRNEELPGYRSCVKANDSYSHNDTKFLAEYAKRK